jgi:hypothetical protein
VRVLLLKPMPALDAYRGRLPAGTGGSAFCYAGPGVVDDGVMWDNQMTRDFLRARRFAIVINSRDQDRTLSNRVVAGARQRRPGLGRQRVTGGAQISTLNAHPPRSLRSSRQHQMVGRRTIAERPKLGLLRDCHP